MVGRLSIAAVANMHCFGRYGNLPYGYWDGGRRASIIGLCVTMPDFHRYYVPDALIFITGVTRNRLPYLAPPDSVALFFETLRKVQEIHPFNLIAYAILPDHFHWVMRVNSERGDFSAVLHSIKRNFTLNYKKSHGISTPFMVWQARFWDHIIRDAEDLDGYLDYIHWNPVKHGYLQRPGDWRYSTYLHWQGRGYYDTEWGTTGAPATAADLDLE